VETSVVERLPRQRRLPLKEPPITDSARRPRVLLAEDDADMRRLVGLVLRMAGYNVVEADSGVMLLRRIELAASRGNQPAYDAIVSDVYMPDLTAIEVLEALQSRDLAIPSVLITAYGNDETRSEARSLGVVDVLEKPLDWSALRSAVQKAVAHA
jgi:two-component system response regulator GlrR